MGTGRGTAGERVAELKAKPREEGEGDFGVERHSPRREGDPFSCVELSGGRGEGGKDSGVVKRSLG